MELSDLSADIIEGLSVEEDPLLSETLLEQLFETAESLERLARELYSACGPAPEAAREYLNRIDAEIFGVEFVYEDEDHFTFILPPLLNRRSGDPFKWPYRALREQFAAIKQEYGIERKSGRTVCFKHYITESSRAADYDNMEISGVLNLLVDTCLADDSIQNYTLIQTRGYCASPGEQRCEVSVFPESEL